MPQEPTFNENQTIFHAVAAGLARDAALLLDYEQLSEAVASPDADHASTAYADQLDRLHELQSQMESSGAWQLRSRVERVLDRLSLAPHAQLSTLSGGTRKRVALARALVTEPSLLVLDEPTNHLDIDSIRWLEELIVGFRGAVLLVTHDRRFLDRVATRVLELDRGKLRSYPGSFAAYQSRKAEQLAAENSANEKFDKRLAQEEVWIRKGIEARRTRNEGRVRRLEQLRRDRAARRDVAGRVRIGVTEGDRSGKLVAELQDVSKRFGKQTVVRDFSATLMRGDKVGLIGANGIGKTTLLKLILGELAPDSGQVRRGTGLQVAYFDQLRAQLDEEVSLVETISPGSDWVEVAGERRHVMSYLGDFLFAPERARSPVRTLSGGERNRLLLARLFAKPANVLVLDEPTNDLDIETLELLESLLQDYSGTLFLVSHDRVFLDNVVTQTIAAEGDGLWREYAGGYDDYESALKRAASASKSQVPASPKQNESKSAPTPMPAVSTKSKVKLSYKENRELESLPGTIERLEAEQKSMAMQLSDVTLYQTDPKRVKALADRNTAIDAELVSCLERWEALEAKTRGA